MSDYLDVMFDECKNIRDVAEHLGFLSKSFYMTGNEVMSEKLATLSEEISISQENINHAVSTELNRRTESARDSVGETLKLVLDNAIQGEPDA